MTSLNTTREALLVDALGEAARLIQQVEALAPALDQSRQAMVDAHGGLAGQLAAFQSQVTALTDHVKVRAVQHILARTDEAARRSIDLQSRAMADAARVALGAELGATLQRLQALTQQRAEHAGPRWEPLLTHAAVAAVAAAASWMLAAILWAT